MVTEFSHKFDHFPDGDVECVNCGCGFDHDTWDYSKIETRIGTVEDEINELETVIIFKCPDCNRVPLKVFL